MGPGDIDQLDIKTYGVRPQDSKKEVLYQYSVTCEKSISGEAQDSRCRCMGWGTVVVEGRGEML